MKKFIEDFKAFALKGNVIDMAVGVVVGSAFSAIVNSIVKDLITPLLGIILGGVDFSGLTITVKDATITYGNLIQSIINFLVISLTIFIFIKILGSLSRKKKAEEIAEEIVEETKKSDEAILLEEILETLKSKKEEMIEEE